MASKWQCWIYDRAFLPPQPLPSRIEVGTAGSGAWCVLTRVLPVSEAHGPCGEYGCDLTCNHGGCQEVARVCPVGFTMTETAVGIRCTGERPGSWRGRGGRGFCLCRPSRTVCREMQGKAEPGRALV